MKKRIIKNKLVIILLFTLWGADSYAQTDIDAIMMEKNAFCVGPMYMRSSWKNYWEGTLKRQNLNLGRITTDMYSLMGIYGVNRNLNVLFSAPYVKTKASAGTLHSDKGFQDMTLLMKWRALQRKIGNGNFSLFGIGGISFPLSNYEADYLPISIGLHSTNLIARAMVDFQQGNLFVTASGTYVYRSNITIDRNAYYTTEMHLTNEVEMPDGASFNFRAGYRSYRLIAEAVVNQWNTLGGFDITRNNMPFPSNKMNSTTVGANFKYVIPGLPQLSLVGGGDYTVAGRNVGQTFSWYGSFFYVFNLGGKKSTMTQPSKTN